MTEAPLVTIVTPSFNAADHLTTCIDSVRAQTYERVEHWVIDGGSKDGTVEILESTPSVRWISEPDRGQPDALAKGFARAEGSIVTWVNADDELAPGGVERVVGAFSEAPAAGWVYGRGVIRGPGSRTSVEPVSPIKDADLDFGNPFTQAATFFTRELFEAVGGIDHDLHLSMDLDLFLRFVDHGALRRFVPQTIARMNFGTASKTGSLPREEFLKENVRVYVKNGRPGAAYLALGGIAAYRAMREGNVARDSLMRAEGEAADWALPYMGSVDRARLASAAAVAAGFAEQQYAGAIRAASLRHFARPIAWRSREARARLMHGATHKLADRLRARRLPVSFD